MAKLAFNAAALLAVAMVAGFPALSMADPATDSPAGIELLHKALSLNDQQEAAWKAYRAEAVSPDLAQVRRLEAARQFAKLSSPQRMNLVEAEVKQELAELQRQSAALNSFYATLTVGQRQIFDTMTLPPANEQ